MEGKLLFSQHIVSCYHELSTSLVQYCWSSSRTLTASEMLVGNGRKCRIRYASSTYWYVHQENSSHGPWDLWKDWRCLNPQQFPHRWHWTSYMVSQELFYKTTQSAGVLVITWTANVRASKASSLSWDLVSWSGDPHFSTSPTQSARVYIWETKIGLFQFVSLTWKVMICILISYMESLKVIIVDELQQLFTLFYVKYHKQI